MFNRIIKFKFAVNQVLQNLPSYSPAVQSLFNNSFPEAERHLKQLKQEVLEWENPQASQEVLDLFVQLYKQTKNHKELITTQEEIFFTLLSVNSIYNEDNSQSFKDLFQSYINYDPKRGQAMLAMLKEQVNELIPLGYQKEFFVYGATLEMLNKSFDQAEELFTGAIEAGPKDELLGSLFIEVGMCLNNQVVQSELNLEKEMKRFKGDFDLFCKQNVKNLLDAIIAFEMYNAQDNTKQFAYLFKLIDQTENHIIKEEINAIINEVHIINPKTFQVIFNLIDLLINYQYPDKASAWIKVVFKNKTQQPGLIVNSFGRSLLQYAKIAYLDQKIQQTEQILLDFLNSQQPRVSFLQMMGLTQYSLLLKAENRQYEADEYEKQALNISSKISPNSYIREQIILL